LTLSKRGFYHQRESFYVDRLLERDAAARRDDLTNAPLRIPWEERGRVRMKNRCRPSLTTIAEPATLKIDLEMFRRLRATKAVDCFPQVVRFQRLDV
jgi:hypothetical protein